jgi:hypothetical protein
VAILGLLTARAWTFDGNERLEEFGHERLRSLVAKRWNGPPAESSDAAREAQMRRAEASKRSRKLNLAIDLLVTRELEDADRVARMREALIPEVWSEATFRQRVTHRLPAPRLKLSQATKEKALAALEKNLRRLQPHLRSE